MIRWEYKIYSTSYVLDIHEDELTEFGSKGWELVSAFESNNMAYFVFKRPIQ